jgi:hypothetical protein
LRLHLGEALFRDFFQTARRRPAKQSSTFSPLAGRNASRIASVTSTASKQTLRRSSIGACHEISQSQRLQDAIRPLKKRALAFCFCVGMLFSVRRRWE